MKAEERAGAASRERRKTALRRAACALCAALALFTSAGASAQPSAAAPGVESQPSAAAPGVESQPSAAPSSTPSTRATTRATSQPNAESKQGGAPRNRVVTIREVTIVGRIQKPVAAVDVSRIQPKMTLAELRQPFLQRIGEAIYSSPF